MRYRFIAGFVLVGLASALASALASILASAPAVAQSARDLQEQYCTGDAFRLCSSEIPNEDRIMLCMERKRQLLSPECRAVFDDPAQEARAAAPAARGKPRKPMALVPE